MKTSGNVLIGLGAASAAEAWMPRRTDRPSLLHWVTPKDIQDLNTALLSGWVPLDLEAKLRQLAQGSLADQQIEKNSCLFIALLTAAYTGAFREITSAECDRLLAVLAYVQKSEDAIADYREGGFIDDQQAVRAASLELAPLLQTFKNWRLRHQVPAMWRHS
jgi:hypothetical protein